MHAKLSLTTFRQRISIERRILKLINETMKRSKPLTGLTDGAVLAWARQLDGEHDAQQIQELVKVVTEISVRSMLNTDCSRDVFSTDVLKRSASLRTLSRRLGEALTELVAVDRA